MPPTKYDDFIVSPSYSKLAKDGKGSGITRDYVSLTCPHCNNVFAEVPTVSISKMKSTQCKAHLEVCNKYTGSVAPAPVRASTASLIRQMAEMEERAEARAEARHRESMARISRALGLGDPDAETDDQVIERSKRKREEETDDNNPFRTVANDDNSLKKLRIWLHPDHNSNHDPVINAVRAQLLEQLLEAQKKR